METWGSFMVSASAFPSVRQHELTALSSSEQTTCIFMMVRAHYTL